LHTEAGNVKSYLNYMHLTLLSSSLFFAFFGALSLFSCLLHYGANKVSYIGSVYIRLKQGLRPKQRFQT